MPNPTHPDVPERRRTVVDTAALRRRIAATHDEVVEVMNELSAAEDKMGRREWFLWGGAGFARCYLERARRALGTADRELAKASDPRAGSPHKPIPRRRGRELRKADQLAAPDAAKGEDDDR